MKKEIFKESNSVKVILDDSIKKPWCPHGPTLLFESTSKDSLTRFFSCSACRDRSDCPFYMEYSPEYLGETNRDSSGHKSLISYEEVSHFTFN